jgi:hypothetical protein
MTTTTAATVERQGARRVAAFFLLGAVVGTLGDRIHTFWTVLTYPRPTAWGEAWWVVPEMGCAGVAMIAAHAQTRGALGEAPGGASSRDVASAFAWFAGAYLATGLFRAYPGALALALAAAFVARALSPGVRTSRAMWLHALGTALTGTLAEATLSATGAFSYVVAGRVGNVPVWLPGLYLHAALLARSVERRFPAVS